MCNTLDLGIKKDKPIFNHVLKIGLSILVEEDGFAFAAPVIDFVVEEDGFGPSKL